MLPEFLFWLEPGLIREDLISGVPIDIYTDPLIEVPIVVGSDLVSHRAIIGLDSDVHFPQLLRWHDTLLIVLVPVGPAREPDTPLERHLHIGVLGQVDGGVVVILDFHAEILAGPGELDKEGVVVVWRELFSEGPVLMHDTILVPDTD